MKGRYQLIYTVDGHEEELLVEVELKAVDGLLKPFQNVYYGIAHVNGSYHHDDSLRFCVNARFSAERIGAEEKDKIKKKCRAEGKSFRQKKEVIS